MINVHVYTFESIYIRLLKENLHKSMQNQIQIFQVEKEK